MFYPIYIYHLWSLMILNLNALSVLISIQSLHSANQNPIAFESDSFSSNHDQQKICQWLVRMQLHHTYWKLTTRSLSLALSAFTLFVCFSPALFELRNAFELLHSHLDDLFAALSLSLCQSSISPTDSALHCLLIDRFVHCGCGGEGLKIGWNYKSQSCKRTPLSWS